MDAGTKEAKRGRDLGRALYDAMNSEGLYALVSAALVLAVARLFYGSLEMQTEHVVLWQHPESLDALARGALRGPWSAPLDDVFIHFDFARSAARGAPFEWTEGNGYSSGGTSLLYPFVLAFGYLVGYRGLGLMHYAGIVACVTTLLFLLGVRRLFKPLPGFLALLAPPLVLSTGVLNWSLMSGMEVSLFLGLWGLCLTLFDDLLDAVRGTGATRLAAAGLGFASALLAATRPEAAPLVAIFAGTVGLLLARKRGISPALVAMILIGAPGAIVVLGQLVLNHVLTGTSSAAGALAKLELHHPYLTSAQVRDAWLGNVAYQIRRVAEYHLSAVPFAGYAVWVLGALAFLFEKTRRQAVLLWVSMFVWIGLVALNGQVRWQNERYTMPALAWLLLSASLGVAGTIEHTLRGRRTSRRFVLLGVTGALLGLFVAFELPRFREQVWFFGRASRNILEQHVQTGNYLRRIHKPTPRRVLVSDAGAIPYVGDLPAFDLIGLGGYGHLPIAQASRQGVGAAIELIEHMPKNQRPDIMALYPSWWGTFLVWFGRPIQEFNVRGNVICGGLSKVVYEPNWAPLEKSGHPFSLRPGEHVVDTIDLADLLSEKSHKLQMTRPHEGYVDMKILSDPRDPRDDLWDAGRRLGHGLGVRFEPRVRGPGVELLVRVAPASPAKLRFEAPGVEPKLVPLTPADRWQEIRIPLDTRSAGPVTLSVVDGETTIHHVFVVRKPKAR